MASMVIVFGELLVGYCENCCLRIIETTISNIIAMEAPSGGKGAYTLEQITDAFQTAFTAFSAAKAESEKSWGQAKKNYYQFW